MAADDQIYSYFFSDYDPSAGGRVALGLHKQKLQETFPSMSSIDLITICVVIDGFVRNERNYNLQVEDPFETSTRVSVEGLKLVKFFEGLPDSTPEKNRFKAFMSYYYQSLVDNRPFSDDDTAGAYLERFRAHTQMKVAEDASLRAFRIVCGFSLLVDMIIAIAYSSAMTIPRVHRTLNDMQRETERLKQAITDFSEQDYQSMPEALRRLLMQLAEDKTDFPKGGYMYYVDSSEAKPGGGLDGLLSRQIGRFNARVSQRDLGLMALTYKREAPATIRRNFPWQWFHERFWCLAREVELCNGLEVIPSVEMIIAFRGSWSVKDWVTDFSAVPVPLVISDADNPALVHWGFHRTLNEHWKDISILISKVSAATQTKTSSWKFRVVGHSLGASWARLAALKISMEHQPIHKIHMNLAAYPGVFFRAQNADAKRETLIVRNYYLKFDIVVAGGSLAMIRDLPAWEVSPKTLYLPIGSHFIFNIDEMMAMTGDQAPSYHYVFERGFTEPKATSSGRLLLSMTATAPSAKRSSTEPATKSASSAVENEAIQT